MNMTRNLVLLASVAALGACSANFKDFDEVKALNAASGSGSPFTQKLVSEYKTFVNYEVDQMHDHADGLHFARKGLSAARGDVVMPEQIADWNLQAGAVQELSAARARLINVFDLGARETNPDLSAVAQARFDCWIEQQEEGWQSDDIAACKNQFMDALNQLEAAMPAKAPEPAPEPAPFDVDASQPMKPENSMYLVFFDFDESTLGPGAASVLDSVASEVSGRTVNAVRIVGHADTSGSNAYNDKLAMKRANAVREALIQRGVNASLLQVDGRGENELMVQTADGVREPANRRAQISFE